MRLLVATYNPGKLGEYDDLLDGLGLDLCGLAEIGPHIQVEETGQTFTENALLKAQAYSRASNLLTLADDSGLTVEALDGDRASTRRDMLEMAQLTPTDIASC